MRLSVALLLLSCVPAVSAQQASSLKAPVDQLAWMVGEWEGPASITEPRGVHHLRQTERVEAVAMGTAIAVRGQGYEKMPDGTERVTFEAFAVLSRMRDGSLGFRAWNMEGRYVDPTVEVGPDGITWGFDDPRGVKIRYVTTHTPDDQWHEVGSWSRDGTTWTQFMEMRLSRVTR